MKRNFMLAGLFLIAGALRAVWAGLPEPSPQPELQKEIGIMARVIEESLDAADWGKGGGWRSRGLPGGPEGVRGEYIPTVGAIFTVRIGFPLSPPKADEKLPSADDKAKSDDLWERSANGGGHEGPAFFGDELPSGALDGIREGIHEAMENVRESLAEAHEDVRREMRDVRRHLVQAEEAIERKFQDGGMTREQRDAALEGIRSIPEDAAPPAEPVAPEPPLPPIPPDPAIAAMPMRRPLGIRSIQKYDEKKPQILRDALLGALAKYGHRLEHLNAAENITIVVESGLPGPGDRMFERRIIRSGPGRVELFSRDDGEFDAHRLQEEITRNVEESIKRNGKKEEKRIVIRGLAPRRNGATERYVIVTNKGAVATELPAADLTGKIKEYRY